MVDNKPVLRVYYKDSTDNVTQENIADTTKILFPWTLYKNTFSAKFSITISDQSLIIFSLRMQTKQTTIYKIQLLWRATKTTGPNRGRVYTRISTNCNLSVEGYRSDDQIKVRLWHYQNFVLEILIVTSSLRSWSNIAWTTPNSPYDSNRKNNCWLTMKENIGFAKYLTF